MGSKSEGQVQVLPMLVGKPRAVIVANAKVPNMVLLLLLGKSAHAPIGAALCAQPTQTYEVQFPCSFFLRFFQSKNSPEHQTATIWADEYLRRFCDRDSLLFHPGIIDGLANPSTVGTPDCTSVRSMQMSQDRNMQFYASSCRRKKLDLIFLHAAAGVLSARPSRIRRGIGPVPYIEQCPHGIFRWSTAHRICSERRAWWRRKAFLAVFAIETPSAPGHLLCQRCSH